MIAAKVVAIIVAVFGIHGPEALRVAHCESRLQPRADNGSNFGIFQINAVHRRHGESVEHFRRRMFSIRANVHTAFALSHGGRDWSPWTCRP